MKSKTLRKTKMWIGLCLRLHSHIKFWLNLWFYIWIRANPEFSHLNNETKCQKAFFEMNKKIGSKVWRKFWNWCSSFYIWFIIKLQKLLFCFLIIHEHHLTVKLLFEHICSEYTCKWHRHLFIHHLKLQLIFRLI